MTKWLVTLYLLACAAPLHAQPTAVFDAEVDVLRSILAKDSPTPVFKAEAAHSYWQPYLADDTMWEKAARTAWYAAQLPAGFPKTGTVFVFYLSTCVPNAPQDPVLADVGNISEGDLLRALDVAEIRNALESKGIADVWLGLQGRTSWDRSAPDRGLRGLNEILEDRFEMGKLSQPLAVLEPFCPVSERGSYEQELENWINGGKVGPKPIEPPPPPPAPPPPPPAPAVAFIRPLNSRVWIASEFQADICKVRTGSYYDAKCDWTELTGNRLQLAGRLYRYRVQRADGPERDGAIDLQKQPSPIDLTN